MPTSLSSSESSLQCTQPSSFSKCRVVIDATKNVKQCKISTLEAFTLVLLFIIFRLLFEVKFRQLRRLFVLYLSNEGREADEVTKRKDSNWITFGEGGKLFSFFQPIFLPPHASKEIEITGNKKKISVVVKRRHFSAEHFLMSLPNIRKLIRHQPLSNSLFAKESM